MVRLIFQIEIVLHLKKTCKSDASLLMQIENVLLKWQNWRLLVMVHVVASTIKSLYCVIFLFSLSVKLSINMLLPFIQKMLLKLEPVSPEIM